MKELEEEIKTNGRTYTLLKRNKYKAMYKSDDDVYEVFKIKIAKPAILFGVEYPEREVYPSSEEFGHRAWCTMNKQRAEEIYDEIKEKDENMVYNI